jgi:predicted hydrocarbon binding protein
LTNYYNEIKEQLINNEVYKKVKDYSKNRSDLNTYYNVGKLLYEAGKHYGEGIIKNYSIKLTNELGKGYSTRNLKYMRKFYLFQKGQTLSAQLTWSHYIELLWLNDINEISYYIKICENQHLSVRELRNKIKNKEYERLDEDTKNNRIKKRTYWTNRNIYELY